MTQRAAYNSEFGLFTAELGKRSPDSVRSRDQPEQTEQGGFMSLREPTKGMGVFMTFSPLIVYNLAALCVVSAVSVPSVLGWGTMHVYTWGIRCSFLVTIRGL